MLNFEEKLVAASSDEILKAAKLLLKSDKLVSLYRTGTNILNAIYCDKNRYEQATITIGTEPHGTCSCGECGTVLCSHVIAGIMQLGRIKNDRNITTTDDNAAKYAGLKQENFSGILQNLSDEPHAELFINAESAFPHVPSKWENAVIVVKMKIDNKEYSGNLNNLRQLHFSKSLSVSLKLNYFSLHERQIIRFLAVNSEQDGAKLLMDAEQTAEFFHCLIDYPRFFKDGRRVIIHRESAETVMLCANQGLEYVLSPALIVSGSILPLPSAKVITGRAGCWVGTEGEYWWVPGTVEVSWLRNFLRNGEQRIKRNDFNAIAEIKEKWPIKIIELNQDVDLSVKACAIWLSAAIDLNCHFILQVKFGYDGIFYEVDECRSTNSNGQFWLRDEKYEKAFIEELKLFGFKSNKNSSSAFTLEDIESAGFFLDKVIPEWQQRLDLVLNSDIARLCAGGRGVPQITLKVDADEFQDSFYPASYKLFCCGIEPLNWCHAVNMYKENRNYFLYNNSELFCINLQLRSFISKANDIIEGINVEKSTFKIPRCAIHYWIFLGREIPGSVPNIFFSSDFFSYKPVIANTTISAVQFNFIGELRKYQQDGVSWMRQLSDNNFNVILADEMGLGKTIQILSLLTERLTNDSAPALVICPASLVENWKREAERFIGGIRVAALSGAGRQEIWNNYNNYNIIIISYASARRDIEFIDNIKFSYLILDEAQHIKNPNTANAKTCKTIKADHRLVLTGTPLENSPDDLWSIFDYLHPGLLGSYNNFKKYYCGISQSKTLMNDLSARVAPFIKRRVKSMVCDELPPKQEQILYCEMDAQQRILYNAILEQGRIQCNETLCRGSRTEIFEIFTILLRLRQVCCDPNLLPNNNKVVYPSAKMELLQELVMQNLDSGHKMLIFSQFTSMLSIIRAWLESEQINFEYLDGATKNRMQHVDNFNNDEQIPVFLLSLKAGGVGLNLTAADTVIIYDPWWNPAVELQATDRTHRIGQTKTVNSIKLVVKDSIEEKILAMQSHKQEIFDNIIENPAAIGEKISLEELRLLFSSL